MSKSYFEQVITIVQNQEKLKQKFQPARRERLLTQRIEKWKLETMKEIEKTAVKTLKEVHESIQELNETFSDKMHRISEDLEMIKRQNRCDQETLDEIQNLLNQCDEDCQSVANLRLSSRDNLNLPLISVSRTSRKSETPQSPENTQQFVLPEPSYELFHDVPKVSSVIFESSAKSDTKIQSLFRRLRELPPMEMSVSSADRHERERQQMENFLSREFGFENISDEYLAFGIKSFRLKNPPDQQNLKRIIHFPHSYGESFSMTIDEILKWQKTFTVYSYRNLFGMTKEFLQRSLQGKSKRGSESFRMKFVVRISTCPILMDADGHVFHRQPGDEWVNRIKLVTGTPIDFAGRGHDINDVTTYISNWDEIFEMDQQTNAPIIRNGRDFVVRNPIPHVEIDTERLLKDLTTMIRIRLRACDQENVQIVIETGFGLGAFAGQYIGVDLNLRKLSAMAIRQVLETTGASYNNILAIIFALPNIDKESDRTKTNYQIFSDEFSKLKYSGPIPVLIIDQDIHRLAVTTARDGFRVSELHPADSHTIFGGYWQNRGRWLPEYMASSTVGLLVQHHLLNKSVLDPSNYLLINI